MSIAPLFLAFQLILASQLVADEFNDLAPGLKIVLKREFQLPGMVEQNAAHVEVRRRISSSHVVVCELAQTNSMEKPWLVLAEGSELIVRKGNRIRYEMQHLGAGMFVYKYSLRPTTATMVRTHLYQFMHSAAVDLSNILNDMMNSSVKFRIAEAWNTADQGNGQLLLDYESQELVLDCLRHEAYTDIFNRMTPPDVENLPTAFEIHK